MWNSLSPCGAESVALLDQLTSFGERESLMIQASSSSGRMSAVSSTKSVDMLQSVAARWRCTKWFGNWKFPGSHPSKYLWSLTFLNINDYMTGTLSKAISYIRKEKNRPATTTTECPKPYTTLIRVKKIYAKKSVNIFKIWIKKVAKIYK